MFMALFLFFIPDAGKIMVAVADGFYFRFNCLMVVWVAFFFLGAFEADTVGIEPAHDSAVGKRITATVAGLF
jgi:hypothetical protein